MTRPKSPDRLTRAKAAATRDATLAELLADGVHPNDAAVQMGFVASYGRVLLAKIRKQLGAQAR